MAALPSAETEAASAVEGLTSLAPATHETLIQQSWVYTHGLAMLRSAGAAFYHAALGQGGKKGVGK